jgi:hypothetical protein
MMRLILLLIVASALVLGLAACGPPPDYQAPVVDLTRPDPEHIAADGLLRVRAKTLDWAQDAAITAQREDVRVLVHAPIEGFDPLSPQVQLAATALAYADGRVEDGLATLAQARAEGKEDAALMAFHVEQLVKVGRYPMARSLAAAGLDRFPDDAALKAAGEAAIDEDRGLIPEIKTLIPDQDLSAIKALGGGSTVTLRILKGEQTVAAFKPDQDLGQSMYRSEVAYFRLCALLQCSFRVPHNAHVRIEQTAFWLLYNRIESDKQRNYKGKLSHMLWEVDPEDGLTYVHGTLKAWVPDFVGFNIEATGAWTPFLSQGSGKSMSQDATAIIAALEAVNPPDAPRVGNLYKRMEGMTVKQVMQQLSDLLVMDFLTNNWDRFSANVELYGANCHFEPGGFVAIDNGAAFPEWHTGRVAHRIKLTQKFSSHVIGALRRMEYDPTLRRLFPNPTKKELARFKLFWERRTQLLAYVDDLIRAHGERNVLVFKDLPANPP